MIHKTKNFFASSDAQTGTLSGAHKPIFEDTAHRAIKAAHRRKWTLVGTIVFLLAVMVAGIIKYNIDDNKQKVLVGKFLSIDFVYNNETEKAGATAKLNPLVASVDHSESTEKFAQFAKENPTHPLGWVAALRASSEYLENQKVAEAQALLEPILPKTLKHTLIQIRVRRALAGIYAEQGNFDKSIKELTYAEQIADNPVTPDIKLFRAQVLYMADKKEEAGKLLKELSANTFSPEAKSVADEASLWLGFWNL